MKLSHLLGGVGLVLLVLVVLQGTFGARGSTAQSESSPWYFQVNSDDTCSELAYGLFKDATRCEELIAVNPHIRFSAGEPILVAGETYWLPRAWTWVFSTFDGGKHALGRYPPMIAEQSLIPPPLLTVETDQPTVVVEEVSDDITPFLIFAYAAGMVTLLLAGLILRAIQYRLIPYAKRRWPHLGARRQRTTTPTSTG